MFCVAATLTVVIVGTIVGWVLFPIGPVTLLSGAKVSVGEGLLRLLAIAAYVSVSLLGLSAIGLFLSTLTTVPVGAMAATAILAVAAQIVGAIPQLEALHPWLFTDHWLDFGDLLREPPVWDSFVDNALLQAGYLLVFGALGDRPVPHQGRAVVTDAAARASSSGRPGPGRTSEASGAGVRGVRCAALAEARRDRAVVVEVPARPRLVGHVDVDVHARLRQLVARERPDREVPDAEHGVVEEPPPVDDEHGVDAFVAPGSVPARNGSTVSRRSVASSTSPTETRTTAWSRSRRTAARSSAKRAAGSSVAPSTATSRRPAHELCRNSSAIQSSRARRSSLSSAMRSRLRPCAGAYPSDPCRPAMRRRASG